MTIGDDVKERMQQIADALDTTVRNSFTDSPVEPIVDSQIDGLLTRYGFGHEGPKDQANYPKGYPIALPGIFPGFNRQPGVSYQADTFLDILLRALSDRLGGVEETWNYLDTTKPAGVTADVQLLYQFDPNANPLNDKSGEGRHLTVYQGAAFYTHANGLFGLALSSGTSVRTAIVAALQLTGAYSCELIMEDNKSPISSSFNYIYSMDADQSGGEDATNTLLYSLTNRHSMDQEATSFNYSATFTDIGGTGVQSRMVHLVGTRASDGITANLYRNGERFGPKTISGLAATVGPQQRFNIGGSSTAGTGLMDGTVYSLRFWDVELTPDQVLNSYRRIRGLEP